MKLTQNRDFWNKITKVTIKPSLLSNDSVVSDRKTKISSHSIHCDGGHLGPLIHTRNVVRDHSMSIHVLTGLN